MRSQDVSAMNRRKKRAQRNRQEKAKLDRDHRKISALKAREPGPWGAFGVWRELREAVSTLIAGKPRPAQQEAASAPICRDCGAPNDPDSSECWLCQRRDWKPGAIAVSARSESYREELPLPPGDQARKAAMSDDVVAMIARHRRERASALSAETPDRARLMSSVATILIVLALAVVEVGVARLAPGLGIALLILLVPAWAITEWRARRQNTPMSAERKFAWIVGVTILIPVLLVVMSLIIAVSIVCVPLMLLI
jgi:hypothetical protein